MSPKELLDAQQARGDTLAETVDRYLAGEASRNELAVAARNWRTWAWQATGPA